MEHHFTTINDIEKNILRDEEHRLKKIVDNIVSNVGKLPRTDQLWSVTNRILGVRARLGTLECAPIKKKEPDFNRQ